MNNYIQTKELTEMFNISRTNLYYWLNKNKISQPVQNSTYHYLWEQKHIEEIRDVLKRKSETGVSVRSKGDYFDLNNRRYLGNKYKLIAFIKSIVKEHCHDINTFFDTFSGSGVVADAFSEYTLFTNDILFSNYVSNYAFLSNDEYDQDLIIYLIDMWNNVDEIVEDNYMSVNFGNKYFSMSTARKIGFIREEIAIMSSSNKINKREEYLLITALLYAMDKIANTCGHYDAYRKNTKFNDKLILRYPNIKANLNTNQIFNMNSNQLVRDLSVDLAYIDPPYNSRQYSDAYHLLENVAKWNKPKVFGDAAKMDRKEIKSDYCTKKAPTAFRDLISNLDAKYYLVSYNNMGNKGNDRSNARISDLEMLEILNEVGEVLIFEKDYRAFSTGKSDIGNHKERLFLCKNTKYFPQKHKVKINVASPLNYTGGKYKLLDQMKPLFPQYIDHMIDLFSGGCNVGANVACTNVKFIDKQTNLIRLFNSFRDHSIDDIMIEIESIISTYGLSNTDLYGYDYYGCNSSQGIGKYNKDKFMHLRDDYNSRIKDNFHYDMIFYVLIVYGFNNQIRFNKMGQFNLPVGKRDFNMKMRSKLSKFVERLKHINYEFIAKDFIHIDTSEIPKGTFVYADPPYLITTATYNEQGGWNEFYEIKLLDFLDCLNKREIKFALSNVIESKGKRNDILMNWILRNKKTYKVHYLNFNYSNSNYQTKDRHKNSTIEVLVTNY